MENRKLKLKIKKGDKVIVISGKDKGKKGDVISVDRSSNRALVSGINTVKKHMKPSQINPQGGIVTKEMPIHISNIAVIDPKTELATRVGYKILDDGSKVRYAKKSKETIDANKG